MTISQSRSSQRDFTIDFPSYWDITPVERRQSIYGTAGQELSDNLNLDLSGMYAVRHTDRDFTDASESSSLASLAQPPLVEQLRFNGNLAGHGWQKQAQVISKQRRRN